ncbi:putative polysaccharide biosynthesis protein [Clostridium sp. ZS2-4]|uniref:putative polysaccharide biosynthesis protein n=1 Tax=Clostridium sp. ZS2-4 TaxID=2987703 RepID=UPI00227A72BD|nr:polysaccharide biosynthesis protein [Clostridium sp. ZS2-4]MCY6355006.1 polysaccharide biosynthesis protein [Clostridium sp. ZS2-4]
MKKQSTTKGFAILSAAGMIVKVLSLLYIPFLGRIIGEEGWGIYSSAYRIYAFVYVLTNSGIPVAISKSVSEFMALERYEDAVKSFKIARMLMMSVGTVMAVLMFVLAKPLALATSSESSTLAIMALAPTIFLTSIVSTYRGYFQGRGNMTPTAVSQVIEQVLNTIFTLVFAAVLLKYGIEAACAGGTIGTAIGSLGAVIYLIIAYKKNKRIVVSKGYKHEKHSRYSNKQILKKIIYYGLPIIICVGLQNAGELADLAIVKSRLIHASGYTQKLTDIKWGVYTKYRALLGVPIALISALSASVLPSLSGAFAVKDRKSLENKINYTFRLCLLVAIPSAVGLSVLSHPIFKLIFPDFEEGWKLMLLGSIVLVLTAVVQIQMTILQSINKLYLSTFFMILGVIGKIVANYFLVGIPQLNIVGAVFGNMICFAIPLVLNYIFIRKALKIKLSIFYHAAKPLMASGVMGIMAYGSYLGLSTLLNNFTKGYLNNAISCIAAIGIGVFAYMYGLVLSGGITQKDMGVLPARIKRFIPGVISKKIQ